MIFSLLHCQVVDSLPTNGNVDMKDTILLAFVCPNNIPLIELKQHLDLPLDSEFIVD